MSGQRRPDVLRFAGGSATFVAVLLTVIGAYCFYGAWRFAFRYQDELLEPVRGRQAAYQQLFLQAHGHAGVVILALLGMFSLFTAASSAWRFWTRFPAAILAPDHIWLHPSFGKKPVAYSNIVGVRLARIYGGRQVGLVIDLEAAAERNRVIWAAFGSRYKLVIRENIVRGSLSDLARFRDRLAQNAETARTKLQRS